MASVEINEETIMDLFALYTESEITAINCMKGIEAHLRRIRCRYKIYPYTGINVKLDGDKVRVFDACGSALYDPEKLLEVLKNTREANTDPCSDINIWKIIECAFIAGTNEMREHKDWGKG